MAPGKSISIASAQLVKADGSRQNWNGVTLASNTVASDKTAKLNIAQVSDYNFKKVAVKVNYPSTEIGHLTSKEFILPLYQYNLAIASDKSEIVGDDTAKVTVSGGKPGETVAWSNTGSGKILDGKSTTFDDKGNAYATVQGTAPFTDTIRANFDNFNSKLSIPINIKNYDDINISKVENYYCNGNSLTFQPHIYNYKIAYWRVVKSIEIEISGQSDDYAQVIVNNSITVHPNLQDTLGIKDGIYIWGKTQSSDYVKEKHPFTMTNENLNIQFGTVNTLPTACYLKASLKIRLFF